MTRIFYFNEEHETVELSFRKRIGTLLLDWVLGGEDEERLIEGVSFS